MRFTFLSRAIVVAACVTISSAVWADEVDFSNLPAGTIVDSLSKGLGVTGNLHGTIGVFGFNPSFGGSTNTAVIFDSGNPTGGDLDFGTPNEDFGGPGIGIGGEFGMPYENGTPLGNLLVVAQDLVDVAPPDGLVDNPGGAEAPGMFLNFDFSTTNNKGTGTVTVNSVTLIDVEQDQGISGAYIEFSGPSIPTSQITVPPTGDNGVIVIDGIGIENVANMRVYLYCSAALANVVIDERKPRTCWITTGGFINAGVQSGGKDFTFGGNVGPPPSGSWEVIDHNTGDNFHSNDVHIVECLTIEGTGPQQPGGKKGLTTNVALFEGIGRLNGVPGYPFTGYVIDGGEPQGTQGNDHDYFELEARDPGTNVVVFFASGELDGGNVQIHPGH